MELENNRAAGCGSLYSGLNLNQDKAASRKQYK